MVHPTCIQTKAKVRRRSCEGRSIAQSIVTIELEYLGRRKGAIHGGYSRPQTSPHNIVTRVPSTFVQAASKEGEARVSSVWHLPGFRLEQLVLRAMEVAALQSCKLAL